MATIPSSTIQALFGATAVSATSVIHQYSQMSNVVLKKEIGYLVMNGDVQTFLGADVAETTRQYQAVLPCLDGKWDCSNEMQTQSYKKGCTFGEAVYQIGKTNKVSFDTRFLPPVAHAAMLGDLLASPEHVGTAGILMITSVDKTLTAGVATILSPVAERIISVQKISHGSTATATTAVGTRYHEVASLVRADDYTLSGNILTFDATEANSVIRIIYTSRSATATDGLAIIENPLGLSKPFNWVGTWLMLDMDSSARAIGRKIIEATNCQRTNSLSEGGDGAQGDHTDTIEAAVNGARNIYFQAFV